jgi:hypothetical protein
MTEGNQMIVALGTFFQDVFDGGRYSAGNGWARGTVDGTDVQISYSERASYLGMKTPLFHTRQRRHEITDTIIQRYNAKERAYVASKRLINPAFGIDLTERR